MAAPGKRWKWQSESRSVWGGARGSVMRVGAWRDASSSATGRMPKETAIWAGEREGLGTVGAWREASSSTTGRMPRETAIWAGGKEGLGAAIRRPRRDPAIWGTGREREKHRALPEGWETAAIRFHREDGVNMCDRQCAQQV